MSHSSSRDLPTPVGTSTRTAAVESPSPRRTPITPTVPLPAEVRAALSGIVKTLRNLPRDCIHDPPELFHFLNRQARALERDPRVAPDSPEDVGTGAGRDVGSPRTVGTRQGRGRLSVR